MREDEQAHARDPSELRCGGRRRVQSLLGTVALFRGERCLVYEHIGLLGRLEHRPRRARIPREHELAAGPGGSEDVLRAHGASVGGFDRLTVL